MTIDLFWLSLPYPISLLLLIANCTTIQITLLSLRIIHHLELYSLTQCGSGILSRCPITFLSWPRSLSWCTLVHSFAIRYMHSHFPYIRSLKNFKLYLRYNYQRCLLVSKDGRKWFNKVYDTFFNLLCGLCLFDNFNSILTLSCHFYYYSRFNHC